MLELETERLILRRGYDTLPTDEAIRQDFERYRIEHEHLDCPFELYHDVTLLSYLQAKEGSPFGHYTLYHKEEGRWIGHCPLVTKLCLPEEVARFRPHSGVVPPHSTLEVEIGWAVSLYYRGQGYATEAAQALLQFAFQTLGVGRVVAFTDQANVASLRVMRRLNMYIDTQADTSTVIGCVEGNPTALRQP